MSGNQLICQGVVACAPASSGDGGPPRGSTNIPFQTTPDPKDATVSTGDMSCNVNSPSSYTTLPGVGALGPVTQGTFLSLFTEGPMLVRTTTYNAGGNVIAVEPVSGMKIVEYDPAAYLVLVEVQGTGPVEYFASGTQ